MNNYVNLRKWARVLTATAALANSPSLNAQSASNLSPYERDAQNAHEKVLTYLTVNDGEKVAAAYQMEVTTGKITYSWPVNFCGKSAILIFREGERFGQVDKMGNDYFVKPGWWEYKKLWAGVKSQPMIDQALDAAKKAGKAVDDRVSGGSQSGSGQKKDPWAGRKKKQ